MIWAVILAAGESRRMKKAKLLLPFGEDTIIETVVQKVLKSRVNNTLVVLGSNWQKTQKILQRYPVKVAVNPHYAQGMLSSVQYGFQVLPEEVHAVVVVLSDQPSIPSLVVDRLIAAYKKTRKGIIVPVFQKNRGHPILLDMKYRTDIEHLKPEEGLRSLVYSHPNDIEEVEVKTESILRDIDVEEDYQSERKKQKS